MNDLFHLDFQTKMLRAFIVSPMRATCHDHLILLDFSLCSFLQPSVTYTLSLGHLTVPKHPQSMSFP